MNSFSKIVLGSSIVLGAVLFGVGCGSDADDMCCAQRGEPPIPKIADAVASQNYSNGVYNLIDNYTLTLDGLKDSVDTDNGQVVKCNWYIADESKDHYAKNKQLVKEDSCTNVEIDFSKYANGTEKLVCLEVIDNHGLSSSLNNGGIKDENGGGEIRKKAGTVEDRKRLDCRRVKVIKDTPTPPQADTKIGIYNTRTNGLASTDSVKQGCPFYYKPLNELPANATCEWSVDGQKVGTDCEGMTEQSINDTNSHQICLTVNGDSANKKCGTFQAVEHTAPEAVIGVFSDEALRQPITGDLTKETTMYLSCKDSKNDCPGDNKGLECKWDASSYDQVNGSCEVPEDQRNYNFQDCFNDPNHSGHGPQITSADGVSLTNITHQYVCSSAASKCVEIKLTVTDKRYSPNKSSQTVKRFKVNP